MRDHFKGELLSISTAIFMTVFAVLVAGKTDVRANDCQDVLRDGVYNQLSLKNNQYSSMVMSWQLSKMTAAEARKKMEAGLSIPIDGLPIDGSFTDEQFNSWAQSVKQSLQVTQSTWQDLSILQLTASTAVLSTWENCMANRKGIIATLEVVNNTTLLYKIRYVAIDDNVSKVGIRTGLKIEGGRAIHPEEKAQLDSGRKIGAGTIVVN